MNANTHATTDALVCAICGDGLRVAGVRGKFLSDLCPTCAEQVKSMQAAAAEHFAAPPGPKTPELAARAAIFHEGFYAGVRAEPDKARRGDIDYVEGFVCGGLWAGRSVGDRCCDSCRAQQDAMIADATCGCPGCLEASRLMEAYLGKSSMGDKAYWRRRRTYAKGWQLALDDGEEWKLSNRDSKRGFRDARSTMLGGDEVPQ